MIVTSSKRCIASQARRFSIVSISKILNNNKSNHASTLSAFQLHSSVTNKSCPHQAKSEGATTATVTAGATNAEVELVDIPKLPFIGSMIPQYSNTVPYNFDSVYTYWYESRKKFGDFYCMGFPGMGKGITGETYVMTDANEFMKVLRKEGSFPYGLLTDLWPFQEYYKDAKASGSPGATAGDALFKSGPEWQRIRRFMQSDLLHPAAAKGYVPGMIRACQIASKGAPLHSKTIPTFTTFCSFDMFSSIMFGEFPGLASGKSDDQQEENKKFCNTAMTGLELTMPLLINPIASAMKSIGIKTNVYSTFEENYSESRKIANQKMIDFKTRKEQGELLDDFETMSYASLSIDRYMAAMDTEDALGEDEVAEILCVGLIAALDTTSALLNWSLIHLAMNPEVQEELHREVSENVAAANASGALTEGCFTKSNNVYLDAFLRENQRMTSPVGFNLGKKNFRDDVEIHGRTIPKGNMFILDCRSVGMDPAIVKDPDVFDPTRWFENEVQNRIGTPAEIFDHPLYKAPFSAGARKCPGNRVASYEAKILLSQLVLDWKISFAEVKNQPKSWRDIVYVQGLTIQPEVPELTFERRQ